jgi:hypothetical protein
MLSYTQATTSRTIVPLPSDEPHAGNHRQPKSTPDVFPSLTIQQRIPSDTERQNGQNAGRVEARKVLEQVITAKGEALSRKEVMTCSEARFTEQMRQQEQGEVSAHWSDGWCQGFVEVIIAARDAAPPEILVEPESEPDEPFVVEATVRFRQADMLTDDEEEFTAGIACGQTCFVEDCLSLKRAITTRSLADLFAEALEADDPEAYNVGFILGYADALCRARKTYPGSCVPGAKKIKKRAKRTSRKS